METAAEWEGGDVEKGAKIYKTRCGMCHTAKHGKGHKIGPNLHGLFGRQSGQMNSYSYSDAMKKKNVTWTSETLWIFLKNPVKYIPGTRMVIPGLIKDEERRNVIAYLKKATQSRSSNQEATNDS